MRLRYILLLFTTILVGCGEMREKTADQLAIEKANTIIDKSKKLYSQGRYQETILNTCEAINILRDTPNPPHRKLFFLHRNQANFAERIGRFEMAVAFADSALTDLENAKYTDFENYALEKFSMQKFKASYLRKNFQYQESIDLTIELLQQPNFKEYHHQLKNNMALAFYELGDNTQAIYHFTDLIKNKTLDKIDHMFYLRNRAKTYQQSKNFQAAQTDFESALAIMPSESEFGIYRFQTEKLTGELYLEMGEFERADYHFTQAMGHHQSINNDPTLFNIYELRKTAAIGMGDIIAANTFGNKFDSLNHLHEMSLHAIDTKLQAYMIKVKQEQYQAAVYKAANARQDLLLLATCIAIAIALMFTCYKIWVYCIAKKRLLLKTEKIAEKYNL